MSLPKDPKKLRALVKRYERELKNELKTRGVIHDGSGRRYLIGPYYMILGSLEEALNAFQWFQDNFEDDSGEPFHQLCWALALFYAGEEAAAANRLKNAMLSNLYQIPHVLGEHHGRFDIWHGSNLETKEYLAEMPDEYLELWDDEAVSWAEKLYYSDRFGAIRSQYIDIYHQLNTEPAGEKRSRLVDEAFKLREEPLQNQSETGENPESSRPFLNIPTVSKKDQEILSKQRIDKSGPGTILRDFQMVLETIGPEGVRVAGKTKQFTAETLEALNARLTHPIAIDFKRPRQKSYSNIHGLYLILRSSGLGIVQSSKKSQRLVLNESVLQVWNHLNAEEQYCTLLESWLIRGNPGILGEKHHTGGPWILDCHQFLKRIPKHGRDNIEQKSLNTIRFTVGLNGVALMRFFGFLSLEEFKPEPGKGWNARIYRTAYGVALINVLQKVLWTNNDLFFASINTTKIQESYGMLQPALRPLFPGWVKNLPLSEQEFKPGLYTFKVSLSTGCWRRILVSARDSLEALSSAILSAFDFDNDHLHLFEYKDHFGQPLQILHPDMNEGELFSSEVLVGDLNLEPGNSLLYVFEFRDVWKFKIVVEAIDPPDSKAVTPRVTAKKSGSESLSGSGSGSKSSSKS